VFGHPEKLGKVSEFCRPVAPVEKLSGRSFHGGYKESGVFESGCIGITPSCAEGCIETGKKEKTVVGGIIPISGTFNPAAVGREFGNGESQFVAGVIKHPCGDFWVIIVNC